MDSSKKIVDGYLKLKDWRVKENSNRPFSYGAMNSYMGGEVAKDYWLREIYPQYIADAYVDGHIHIHDLVCLSLYCCGYSLKEILKKGVRGVQNIPVSGPAKHFDSVLNQIANLVTVYQNEIAGAVAFNSFDTLLAPFIKVDGLDYKQVVQNMQNFIYSVNSNSRAGAEPAFSNITFDLTPPEDLLDQKAIVGGKKVDFTYRECQKEMDMLNRAFCEIMLEGDAEGKLFAYPIPTYNIHKRFDWDNPNNDLLWEMAGKFGLPYFANFINSDMEIGDVRSMCPLEGNTRIIYYSDRLQKYCISPIKEVFNHMDRDGRDTVKLLSKGKEVECRINKFDVPAEYEIELVNGAKFCTTANHLNKVYGKDYVETRFLTSEDYIPYSLTPFEKRKAMTYEEGKIVGMFLGDGSYSDDRTVVFSLNEEKKKHLIDFLEKYTTDKMGAVIRTSVCYSDISGKPSCVNVYVNSKFVMGLVQEFVEGNSAVTKGLSGKVYMQSIEFRKGILDGLYETDGGNNNRIYTSSELLRDDIATLCATLGMVTNITADTREGRLGELPCYTVRYYQPKERKGYKDVYKVDDEYLWVKIKEVRYKKHNSAAVSYCAEVVDEKEEPVFMLANGILTHNCRLRLDLRELRKKNGGLFGAGDATGCYDDQTEVLTDNRGWILFKDLTKEDVLITRNPQGIIEKHRPVELFEYDYKGEMYHFHNTVFDMKITPNHKMVFVNKHTWEQDFVRADEYSRNKHPIPRTGEYLYEGEGYFHLPSLTSEWVAGNHDSSRETTWAEKVIPMEDWLRFVGLYLSEGSCDNENGATRHGYRVNITQIKKENFDYIKNVLNKLPFYYKQTPTGFLICDKQLWSYCRNTFGKNCYEKKIPREYLSSCSKVELLALLESLMIGDGSINKGTGQKTYYTTSKQLASDFQELCLKVGFSTNIRQRAPRDVLIDGRFYPKESNAVTYEMTITKNKTFNIAKKDIKKEYYEGKVYCCEVPNHTLYVRRNGKATWCGNSIGVVTINLPRLGYEHKGDKKGFFKALRHYLDIAKDSLEIKRKWLQENILDTNAIPAFMEYVGTMNNHFSVIGEVGANEMCENFMGKNILDPEAHAFVHEVHEFILHALQDYQEETGNLYAFEATPAEGTCYRFAMKDKSIYKDIITQGNGGDPYYTNSCHIPVKLIESIDKTFKHQEDLQVQFNSGTVIHIYLEGAITGEQAKSIIYNVCHNYKVPYVSLSPISRYCPEHGYVKENVDECPICGERLKKYQRITGYLRCVDNFNNGKAAEFRDRKQIKI